MKNTLALLADWTNGLFALLLAAYVTDTEVLWWYVPVALLVSHLPDIDAVPELLRYGKVSASAEHLKDHRTFLHFPVISILLSLATVFIFGFWGLVLFFAILLHLINDLYGTGWGIPLFWPITNRRYKFLGRRANRLKNILVKNGDWQVLEASERRFRIFVSWSPEELVEYIKRWGMDDWIAEYYLKLNWISVTEYSLFILACALTIITLS